MRRILIPIALLTSPALAQTVDPDHALAWGENVGWLNWGATPFQNAPFVHADHLSGYVWGENVGWINLGNGNGPYGNTSDRNFGVNRAGNGQLSGYAWGENVGWINFGGGALAAPRNPARIDVAAGRLRGYAWGENVGWINLDDDTHFVAFRCPGDFNNDGVLNFFDVQAFLNAFSAHDPAADLTHDGVFNFFDVQVFLNLFSAGCGL